MVASSATLERSLRWTTRGPADGSIRGRLGKLTTINARITATTTSRRRRRPRPPGREGARQRRWQLAGWRRRAPGRRRARGGTPAAPSQTAGRTGAARTAASRCPTSRLLGPGLRAGRAAGQRTSRDDHQAPRTGGQLDEDLDQSCWLDRALARVRFRPMSPATNQNAMATNSTHRLHHPPSSTQTLRRSDIAAVRSGRPNSGQRAPGSAGWAACMAGCGPAVEHITCQPRASRSARR